jgi:hypothetical protein
MMNIDIDAILLKTTGSITPMTKKSTGLNGMLGLAMPNLLVQILVQAIGEALNKRKTIPKK